MIKSIIEKLKLKELIGILFGSALIITILPYDIISYLKLVEVREKYQMYISLCLIITSAYYIFNILGFISGFIIGKVVNEKKVAIKYMKNKMSADEMELLIKTFYDNSNNAFKSSGYMEYSDGRKAALESKWIIYLASNISNSNNYGYCSFAYNLQPYAREFLNKNLKNGNIKIDNNSFKYILT
ncbi:super-infection exclusion protein B [Clostridium gasigenes]|uniref:super-infection exclusion protein B n=1 Tax=Clostridium gasigenes TaxID=94869 RepID=UPI001C0CAEF7|nr:super-infection exclusion protein B [Clostridium gasigenes]MBU3103925.1 superinfection exclusion B family protein [Clostridium gasigenes]